MAKKSAAKKSVNKVAKKATKKVATKKTAVKEAPKPVVETPVKKSVTKKAVTKKTAAKKEAVAKKEAAPKKAPAKSAAPKKVAKKAAKSPKAASVTTIVAQTDIGWGNSMYIRGEGGGLSWDTGTLMDWKDGVWTYTTTKATGPVEFKFLINDSEWQSGENTVVEAGSASITTPAF